MSDDQALRTTSTDFSGANEFSGKRVLVTGGTQGTGKTIAERFRRGGATVIVTSRSTPQDSKEHFIAADLSTAEGTSKVIREVLDRFAGVDILINNVGGSSAPSGGFITVTDDLWQRALDENLFPAVRLDRGLLPSMIASGAGVIIHFLIHSTNAASLRFNACVCRGESGSYELQ